MNKKINTDVTKLIDQISNLKKSLMNFNFQKSTGQLEKTSQIRKVRRDIARLKTKLSTINGEPNA